MAGPNEINIEFTFDKGLNEKADEKLTDGMLQLTNAQFEKAGSIKKRVGYSSLSSSFVSSSLTSSITGNLTTGSSLATYDNELLLFTTSSVYSYSQSKSKWVYKNDVYPATVTEISIIANADRQVGAQSARSGSLRVIAWIDEQNNSVNASVQDVVTKTTYQPNAVLVTGGAGNNAIFGGPKVIPCGNYFYVFYLANREIYWRRVDVNNPYHFSNQTTMIPSSSMTLNLSHMYYDIASWKNHPLGDSMLLSHVSGNNIIAKRLGTDASVITSVTTAIAGTMRDVMFCVTTDMTASAQIGFFRSYAGQHYIDIAQYTTAGGLGYVTSSLGLFDFDDVSGGVGYKMCGYKYANDNPYETVKWFLEHRQQYADPFFTENEEYNFKRNYIMTGSYNLGAVGDFGVWLYNASLASEPYIVQGRNRINVTHESDLQGMHAAVEID